MLPNRTSVYDYLPYMPTGGLLNVKTLDMNITMHDGSVNFNSHSINNGYREIIASYSYLHNKTALPFILTRQNSAGTGRFAAHWTGDNISTFKFMRLSIAGILSSALFGIPFTGADICGFGGNTTETLCARWAQLGAWYPFARNHNIKGGISQEFYALGPDVEETARVSFKLRYSLLKHLYSKFVRKGGAGMVYQPLFFADPSDQNLTSGLIQEGAFLIDNETLVYANLQNGTTNDNKYKVIFPKGTWFYLNGSLAQSASFSEEKEIESPLNASAPAFVRAGSIVSMQNTSNVTKTFELDNNFKLCAFMENQNSSASGYLLGVANYTDEAAVKDAFENNCMTEFSLEISEANGSKGITAEFTTINTLSTCVVDFTIRNIEIFVGKGTVPSYTLDGEFSVTAGLSNTLSFTCEDETQLCQVAS